MLSVAVFAAKSSGSGSYLIFIYAGFIGIVYFFFLRPRNRKAKAAREEAKGVEVGDRAVTIGGHVGIVTKIENGLVTLRSESGTESQYIARAISSRYVDPSVAAEPETGSGDTDASGTEGESH